MQCGPLVYVCVKFYVWKAHTEVVRMQVLKTHWCVREILCLEDSHRGGVYVGARDLSAVGG